VKDLGIKLTAYDFLGYFIPGMLATILLWMDKNLLEGAPVSLANLLSVMNGVNLIQAVFAVLMMYILGLAVNGTGAFIIEKRLFRLGFLKKMVHPQQLLTANTWQKFLDAFKQAYGKDYEPKDRQGTLGIVAENRPQVYGRVFFFLVMYGFSRSMMLVLLLNAVLLCALCIGWCVSLFYLLADVVLMLPFAFNYVRFRQYYEREVVFGVILKKLSSESTRGGS